jgi:thioredoxin 1
MKRISHALFLALLCGALSTPLAFSMQTLPKAFQKGKTAAAIPKTTLVEFSAPWCASCVKLKPELANLQKKYGTKLNVIHLNIEEDKTQPYIESFKIETAPTFFLYNNQYKLTKRIDGDISPAQLRELITKAQSAK